MDLAKWGDGAAVAVSMGEVIFCPALGKRLKLVFGGLNLYSIRVA